jgi:hypothetical protein
MPSIRNPLALVLIALACVASGAQFWALRAPARLHLPPQQRVETRNPLVGVHTRLNGYSDEAYTERTLAQVREMGASWIVELFPWAYVQPRSRYGYDWAGADMIVQHASRQGLQIVARIDIVPEWARPRNSTDRQLDPEHYEDYANFVTELAKRYRPYGLRYLQIWNEPNLAFEWGSRPPDPGAYAALLKVVYPRVKAAVPDAVVVAGALSPGADSDGGRTRMADMQFLFSLLDAQAGPFFDVWGVHAYGGRLPPDAPPDESVVNFRRIELYRALLDRLGAADKRIIVTEGGWNDNPRWNAAVRPAERVRWTVAAYEQARRYPWLDALCLWQFSTPFSTRSYPDNWNFVSPDGNPRAVYRAVQRYAHDGLLP